MNWPVDRPFIPFISTCSTVQYSSCSSLTTVRRPYTVSEGRRRIIIDDIDCIWDGTDGRTDGRTERKKERKKERALYSTKVNTRTNPGRLCTSTTVGCVCVCVCVSMAFGRYIGARDTSTQSLPSFLSLSLSLPFLPPPPHRRTCQDDADVEMKEREREWVADWEAAAAGEIRRKNTASTAAAVSNALFFPSSLFLKV